MKRKLSSIFHLFFSRKYLVVTGDENTLRMWNDELTVNDAKAIISSLENNCCNTINEQKAVAEANRIISGDK